MRQTFHGMQHERPAFWPATHAVHLSICWLHDAFHSTLHTDEYLNKTVRQRVTKDVSGWRTACPGSSQSDLSGVWNTQTRRSGCTLVCLHACTIACLYDCMLVEPSKDRSKQSAKLAEAARPDPHTRTMSWGHGGTVARWHGGTVARWHGGTVARGHGGTTRAPAPIDQHRTNNRILNRWQQRSQSAGQASDKLGARAHFCSSQFGS
jgi:hypothetical protein